MKNSNKKTENEEKFIKASEVMTSTDDCVVAPSENIAAMDDDYQVDPEDEAIKSIEEYEAEFTGTLKVAEVIDLKHELEAFVEKAPIEGWQISTCVMDNLEEINRSLRGVEAYEKAVQKPVLPFVKEKNKLTMQYSKVDGVHNVEVIDGKQCYVVPKVNEKKYTEELNKLKDKHKKVLDVYEKRMKEHAEKIQQKDSTYQPIYLSREVAAAEAPKIAIQWHSLIHKLLEPIKKEDTKKK